MEKITELESKVVALQKELDETKGKKKEIEDKYNEAVVKMTELQALNGKLLLEREQEDNTGKEKENKEVVKITLEDQVNKIMRGEENGKN